MNKQSRKKRFLLNGLALLVIVAVSFTAYGNYQKDDGIGADQNLPPLKGEVPYVDVDLQKGEVNVALIVKDTDSMDDIASDTITIFKWGREKLPPFVCGPDYPPNLCVLMWVKITWVTTNGSSQELYPLLTIGLDQIGIDRLLVEQPQGYDELKAFLQDIAERSNGTGLFYQEYPAPPQPFTGFK